MSLGTRLLRLFLLVTLVSAAPVLAGHALAASVPQAPGGFVGMNIGAPVLPDPAAGINPSAQFAHMESVGVETVRGVFDWAYAQPYARWSDVPADKRSQFVDVDGVPTRFTQTDALVADAAARGMTVLPTVLYAPSWDSTGATSKGYGRPARTAPYAAYLTALVKRYGPHGTFWANVAHPVPITEWQIWNEPNITTYWPTQPFATTYVALLHAAHVAITRADPRAQVVTAGLPNYSWRSLESMYRVKGARNDFDVVALHPYTATPADVITILGYVRKVMDANHDSSTPMIVSEMGWTSAGTHSKSYLSTTPKGQAQKLAGLLPLLAENRRRLDLRAFYWYTWASQPVGSDPFNYAGLLSYSRHSLTEKPAYAAYRTAALAMEHCRVKGALATECTRR